MVETISKTVALCEFRGHMQAERSRAGDLLTTQQLTTEHFGASLLEAGPSAPARGPRAVAAAAQLPENAEEEAADSAANQAAAALSDVAAASRHAAPNTLLGQKHRDAACECLFIQMLTESNLASVLLPMAGLLG